MTISFKCSCGNKLSTKDEYAGKKTKCPQCSTVLVVPQSKTESSAKQAAIKDGGGTARTPKKRKGEGFDISGDPVDPPSSGEVFIPKKLQVAPSVRKKSSGDGNALSVTGMQKIAVEESTPPSYVFAIIGGVLGLAVLGGGVAAFLALNRPQAGGNGVAVAPVAIQYAAERYWNPDAPLSIKYPDGWEASGGGGTGGVPPFAEFKKGSLVIKIRGSQSGSARADALIAAANMRGGASALPEEERPEAQLHQEQAESYFPTEFKNFKDGEARTVTTKMGGVRYSEFTADEGFAGKVMGLRATIIRVPHQYIFIAKSPSSEYPKYKAMFEEILKDISIGL